MSVLISFCFCAPFIPPPPPSHLLLLGGCTQAYRSLSSIYSSGHGEVTGDKGKASHYLLELERQGINDGCVFTAIGRCLEGQLWGDTRPVVSIMYYQRAIDLRYVPAYLDLHYVLWHGGSSEHKEKAMLVLLEADKKGICVKDDRILSKAIDRLLETNYHPTREVLGTFKNADEMILFYCDVLISRKSPLGNFTKGCLYWRSRRYSPENALKAVSILEEADRLGFAHFKTYTLLNVAYL